MADSDNIQLPIKQAQTKQVSARTLVFSVSGKEQPYPAYRFSGRRFLERPNHNPFAPPPDP